MHLGRDPAWRLSSRRFQSKAEGEGLFRRSTKHDIKQRPSEKTIDPTSKNTEAGWQTILDRFWLASASEFFRWISWVAAIAALKFVGRHGGGITVEIVAHTGATAMFLYFNAYFFQFTFINVPLLKNRTAQRVASLMMSGLLALGALLMSPRSIDAKVTTKN